MAENLTVYVVHALPDGAIELRLQVAAGSRVSDALTLAGQDAVFAALELAGPVAIFGRRVTSGERLQEGDRVELLRPLLNDPKEARRRRVVSRSGGS